MQKRAAGAARTMDDLFCQDLIVLTVIGMLIAHDADRAKPATTDADDLIALAQGANGDGSDRRIQPRHIPAAGQNTDYALLGGDVGHTPFNLEGFPTSSNWTYTRVGSAKGCREEASSRRKNMANAELKQAEHFEDDDDDDNDSDDVEDVSIHGLSHNTQNARWRVYLDLPGV